MTRVTRRALATLTALVMVGTLFLGAPSPIRASIADPTNVYISFDTPADTGSCASPDYTADGTDDHDVIMEAVSATNTGGTLHFCPGTYDIDATINLAVKRITLQGASAATTILDGGGTTAILRSRVAITVYALTFQDGYDSDGGAIFTLATATVTDSTFTGNSATYYGGAIRSYATTTVTGSTFNSNTAGQYGGAIYSPTATVTDSTFTNNNSADYGGAIYTYATTTVTGSTFTGNRANDFGSYGGAIRAGSAIVSNSSFTSNSAWFLGGAISVSASATISDSTFAENSAGNSGAISASNVNVSGSTFTRNFTTVDYGDGGAINTSTGTITNSTFTNNNAAGNGGAIAVHESISLNHSRFIGNRAFEHGGALVVYLANAVNVQQISRNTFSRNRAATGGAITVGPCTVPRLSDVARLERANRFSGNRATEQRRTKNIERWLGFCGG